MARVRYQCVPLSQCQGITIYGVDHRAARKAYQKQAPSLPFDHPDQTLTLSTNRIHLVSWIIALAYNRIRDLLDHLHEPAPNWTVLTAIHKLIHTTALLQLHEGSLWVLFDPFPEAQVLSAYCEWVNAADFVIPWLNHIRLRLDQKFINF